MQKKIFLIAGEHSGDLHGANLAAAIFKKNPNIQISGIGGPKMQAAGVTLHYDLTDLAVVGFVEVLKNYLKIRKIFYSLLKKIEEEKPDLIILIDYPGFNLRFAKKAKEKNFKIAYYISPQIWAWKKGRIHQIKKYVDKMLVIFEFEKKLYESHHMPVEFVGHPILDILKPSNTKSEFKQLLNIDATKKIIGLLPGSRNIEIKRILPIMLKAATQIKQLQENVVFVLPYKTSTKELMSSYLQKEKVAIRFIEENVYNLMAYADVLLVASGTATLESACFLTPLIVIYKTSLITYLIAKTLLNIPFIAMANVIANEKIIPEYVQYQATPKKIAAESLSFLNNETKVSQIKTELQTKVKAKLGENGASEKAATTILEMIEENEIFKR